jgi:hypothetical protein
MVSIVTAQVDGSAMTDSHERRVFANNNPARPAGPVPLPANVLGRLSARGQAGIGTDAVVAGFIITGSGSKTVLARALGPSLGLPGVVVDPTLTLLNSNGDSITNDNWMETQAAEISATGYAPPNNLESAILTTLPPGFYTLVVTGRSGTTGIATAEVIDVSGSASSQLVNMSSRARVGTAVNIMVAGFTIDGPSAQKVVIRGIGPSLSFSSPLQDPTLLLRDSGGNPIVFNNNWKDTQQAEIQATGIPPPDDRESAMVATLAPGSYTAEMAGACGGTGAGIVEVYHLSLGGAVSIPASSAFPICVTPMRVVSRKSHTGVGLFDVNLPLTTPFGVECRGASGAPSDFQLVFTFPSAVTFDNASVSSGTGSVVNSSGNGTAIVTVNLTAVVNVQTITVTLTSVNDGTRINDVTVQMGVLGGDTNGDGSVSASDVGQTKSRAGQIVNATNFRSDVNTNGAINASDIGLAKSMSGTQLP